MQVRLCAVYLCLPACVGAQAMRVNAGECKADGA